jgi:ComF family protein
MSLDTVINKITYMAEWLFDLLFPDEPLAREVRALTPDKLGDHLNINIIDRGTVALFSYRDELIRHMVWRMKYKNDTHTVELFAQTLADYLIDALGELALFENVTDPLLVAIPLSRKRRQERGYNQVERLVRSMARYNQAVGAPALRALTKKFHTKPQTKLKRRERLVNIAGSFKAREDIVNRRDIILIDDVITTGTTMREAKRTLKQAGARHVVCIGIAA